MKTNTTSTNRARLRVIRGNPAASIAATEPRKTVARRGWQRRVLDLAPVLLIISIGWVSVDRGVQWYKEELRNQQLVSQLHSVYGRERLFSRKNEVFAGSIKALKMSMPTDPALQGRVVSVWYDNRPNFLAEYCDGVACKAIDAQGGVRTGAEVKPQYDADVLPELKEGEGRFFKTVPPGESR